MKVGTAGAKVERSGEGERKGDEGRTRRRKGECVCVRYVGKWGGSYEYRRGNQDWMEEGKGGK